MVTVGGVVKKPNSLGDAINVGAGKIALVMPLSNIQNVIPLYSLSVIMTSTTFAYVVTASEGNFFLSKLPSRSCNCWVRTGHSNRGSKFISGGRVAIRKSWYNFFKKKISRGHIYSVQQTICNTRRKYKIYP